MTLFILLWMNGMNKSIQYQTLFYFLKVMLYYHYIVLVTLRLVRHPDQDYRMNVSKVFLIILL